MKALCTFVLCAVVAVGPGCAWAGGVFEAVTSIPREDHEAVAADAASRLADELALVDSTPDTPPTAGELAEASANAMVAAAAGYWETHEKPPPKWWMPLLDIGLEIATGAGVISLVGGAVSGRSKGMLSALLGALSPNNKRLTIADAPKALWAGLGPGHSGELLEKVAAAKADKAKANKAKAEKSAKALEASVS